MPVGRASLHKINERNDDRTGVGKNGQLPVPFPLAKKNNHPHTTWRCKYLLTVCQAPAIFDPSNYFFPLSFGGGGKYISWCGCDICSSAFAAACAKPGLKGLLGISGLLSACANVGDFGAFGLLKCFLNGNSDMPPNRLNASVRGVAGFNSPCGTRGIPGVKGVAGTMSYSSSFREVLSRWPYLSS